jgi:hypothetical protein
MMNFHQLNGDVIDVARKAAASGKTVFLPHVCNNAGVMGAGVAAALKAAFPGVDTEYSGRCAATDGNCLGGVDYVWVEKNLCICNMIAQDGFRGGIRPPIRYGALTFCMYDVADEFLMRKADVKGIIAPMFGSGLAGGDWGIIKQLIHEHWLDENIDVTITTL